MGVRFSRDVAAWPYPQWPLWPQHGDIGEFCQGMAAVAAAGGVVHGLWYLLFKKGVLSADRYRTDRGDNPRLQDANSFTQLVLSLGFTANWLMLYLGYNPTLFSVGMQSGACAGYEVYGSATEVLRIMGGQVRWDMIMHHAMCVVFTVVTLIAYVQAPEKTDLVFWHIVWDSISRILISNVALNLRYFFIGSRLVNVFFALSFFVGRWFEQIPFVLEVLDRSAVVFRTGTFPFKNFATGGVLACWLSLTILNMYWGIFVLQSALRGGKKKKRGKEDDKQK
eukprot:TRINITY_DN14095_c0_g1_i1.p1 TRINITY_DN14095_c0_g1~~TRINITY_DN14095_c0_g1_i1.p1  ORF type:complete len:303 (+),score=100.07 TRINITY_DN14095_c0_g1_i1:71-910(+)